MEKIKVLVIDDSAIVRDVLSSAISSQPDLELVGTAPDPFVGRDKIVRDKPDVITLDIEMPRMDGLTFLERLMHYYPLPVIIVSSITTKDPYAAIKALELGAFDVVNKPGGSITVEEVKEEVLRKIRQAFDARERFLRKWKEQAAKAEAARKRSGIVHAGTGSPKNAGRASQAPGVLPGTEDSSYTGIPSRGIPVKRMRDSETEGVKSGSRSVSRTEDVPEVGAFSHLTQVATTEKLIAIGASTGGTVALESIFRRLPRNLPPIVVVQHMPEGFTAQFAQRLNEFCELQVKEGEEEELLEAGTVYIAPGGFHMEVVRRGASLFLHLHKGERIQFQRPAVDVLFQSVARHVGKNALGILLTGMGKDGAEGLLALRKAGAFTVAQDEYTSIVWGMPKAAVDLNAALRILSLEEVSDAIVNFARGIWTKA